MLLSEQILRKNHQKMPIKPTDKPLAAENFARRGAPEKAKRRLTYVSRAAFEEQRNIAKISVS